MDFTIFPGYETHLNIVEILAHGNEAERQEALALQQKRLKAFALPEGMTIEDRKIPGADPGDERTIRIYKPAGLPEKAPVIVEIHGGGWVGGNLDIDNHRCIYLAQHTPCIVVGVEYRLAGETVHFPKPFQDCWNALTWVHSHAAELGADPDRIGLHGTSAGANLVGGLALYARDRGGPKIALAVMNCPPTTGRAYQSTFMNEKYALGPAIGTERRVSPEFIYYPRDGHEPSYYAFPGLCQDLSGLCPHMVIVAEYDQLRDEGLEYAVRLLQAGVHCELIQAGRVGHGFCVVHHPLANWVHDGCCMAFQREFGMLDALKDG